MNLPYQEDITQLIAQLQTNAISGLSVKQVLSLRVQYGTNELTQKPSSSWIVVFISQFASPLIYILIIAALLIFFVGDDKIDAFIIGGILLFNAIVGTIQEGRTRKILVSLMHFITQECVVIRDNKKLLIASKELVPGDIILIQAGQRVPADARIIEAHNLKVNEAMLTGESGAVLKSAQTLTTDRSIAERSNIVYSGTYIIGGWAKAVVVAIGMETEIGKIQHSVQEIQTDVPLAKEMQRLSWMIIYFILGMCLFLFALGILTAQPLKELIVMLTALFICVIPEGLPVVLTLVLVSGVYRMAKQRVLVKNMQAVEGLGHANVIVIDKTGTLTRNEMIVSNVFADNKELTVSGKGYYAEGSILDHGKQIDIARETDIHMLAQALSLLNTATITFVNERGTFDIKGDPTEAALFIFSQKAGINDEELKQKYTKIYEIPFDPKYKYHAAFYEHNGSGIAFIAGSPEIILKQIQNNPSIDTALQNFLQSGLRVIAIAMKKFNLNQIPGKIQEQRDFFEHLVSKDLTFLGLCGIEDSIRPEAVHTINKARKAGFQIIMATGDHQRTALAIAKQVGIYKEGDEAIDGPEFDRLSDEQLKDIVIHTTVFSRVTPEQKLRIIQALHSHDLTVAMTGDGINDAPSLVAADIGIGMGGIGTEVAKEASDIILLDDSVVNIIRAIEEGRHTLYALRRVILYFFSTNLAEILIILFAFVLSLLFPQYHLLFPLTAAQILWLNLITDGFLDSALAMEKKEKGLLFDQKWMRKEHIQLIDSQLLWKMAFAAVPMALGSLFVFLLFKDVNLGLARTMTLVTLGMFQWFNAWNCRSDTKSIFQLGLFTNKWLVLATGVVFILQLMLLHIPFLQKIFATQPLNVYQWIFIAIISSSIIVLDEIRKWIVRRSEK